MFFLVSFDSLFSCIFKLDSFEFFTAVLIGLRLKFGNQEISSDLQDSSKNSI